jgi:hypothetical protein
VERDREYGFTRNGPKICTKGQDMVRKLGEGWLHTNAAIENYAKFVR